MSSADTLGVWVVSLAAKTHYLEDSVRGRGTNLVVDSARKLGRKKEMKSFSIMGVAERLAKGKKAVG